MEQARIVDLVEVWPVRLQVSGCQPAEWVQLLSHDERMRARRFVRAHDRDMFVTTRARLREVLASFTGRAPSTIEFEYGATGKPRIVEESVIRFNVSHSHSLGLIAVARGREIGVDIEYQQPPMPCVNRDVFSPNEAERILASSDPLISFYDHWTLKEAALKAAGVGFSSPSAQTDLVPGMVCPFRDFAVRNLNIAIGFSAGLAIQVQPGEAIPAVVVHPDDA